MDRERFYLFDTRHKTNNQEDIEVGENDKKYFISAFIIIFIVSRRRKLILDRNILHFTINNNFHQS